MGDHNFGRKPRTGLNKKLVGAKSENKQGIRGEKKVQMGLSTPASQYLVPFWNQESSEGVRFFIDQLEEAKDLKIFDSEGELIYAALCKSNKPEIFSQLSNQEKNSIQKFAVYLAENFGDTPNELKRKFQQMRQSDQEDELSFFQRVTRAYFAARSIKGVPSGEHFTNDHKEDISLVFISGLRFPEVRRALLTRIDEVEFSKMGRVAKRISLNLRELSNRVYQVGGPEPETTSDTSEQDFDYQNRCRLERKINELSEEVQRLKNNL